VPSHLGPFTPSTSTLLSLPSVSGPFPANIMSQTPPVAPSLKFQLTFSDALRAYKKRTGKELLLHPLAARLQSCNSPDAILSVLSEQAQAIDQSWNGHERLAMWLGPTVDVIYALSSSLGEGVGLVIIAACSFRMCPSSFVFQVSSPAKVIFVGISVLFSVRIFLDSVRGAILTPKSCRRLMPFMSARMGLSTSSDAWTISSDDSTLTQRSHHLSLLRT
jgi:hypothetical protein